MPPVRRLVGVALVSTCLAMPAAARGAGAGDNQYTDPFGNSSTPAHHGRGGGQGSQPGASHSSGSGRSSKGGSDVALLALAGGSVLLTAGLGLRYRRRARGG